MAEIDTQKAKIKIGMSAPDFTLQNVDGKGVSLAEFKDKKAYVIIFMCNHCPYVQAYTERIIQLARAYAASNVQVIAINSNDETLYPEDSFEKMKVYARIRGFPFPYLRDADQRVAKRYDAQCTPEVYVFDGQKKLKYHGRIDDNYQDSDAVREHYLRDAVQAVLNNKPVQKELTFAIGCSIKWSG